MTINDQIRDEKLQYDINREAPKISALSSGKIHKYEYLTGEDILPTNQEHIIEQVKFTYSPLEKAFEKQIKTTEDKGQKQIDALESLKPKEQTKAITYDYESLEQKEESYNKIFDVKLDEIRQEIDALESLKPKEQTKAITYDYESLEQKEESYKKIFDEKLDEIQELSREIDYKNLNYNFTTKASGSINFIKFKGPFSLFKKIRDGDISLKMAEEDQEKFKREFSYIKLRCSYIQ